MRSKALVFGAATALAAAGVSWAQESRSRDAGLLTGGELTGGVLAHGVRLQDDPGPDLILEGTEESGTVDVQLGLRTRPVGPAWLLGPHLSLKAQVNTEGRTNFVSAGAEWRKEVARVRAYLQAGFGLTYQDGYELKPNPFAPGLGQGEREHRYDIYVNRTAFGSKLLFNPNLSAGAALSERWAIEGVWEHYSHKQVFGEQNPGIDNFGLRLVRRLGR